MRYYDSNDLIDVTAVTKVFINMTTYPNITYDKMHTEFIMPTTSMTVHVCRAELASVGRNMPCLTPEWYNNRFQYYPM